MELEMREFDLQQVGGKFESKRVSTGEASYGRVKFFCSFSMTSFCFSSLFQNSFVCNQLKVIPQFCIAHFYCAHLITYNFNHYTYRLKKIIL